MRQYKSKIPPDDLVEIKELLVRRAQLEYDIKPITDRLKQLSDQVIAKKYGLKYWNIKQLRLGYNCSDVNDTKFID